MAWENSIGRGACAVDSLAMSFGGAMSEAIDEQLGVLETMLSTALTGLIYSMLCAPPLCIRRCA
eukprot:12932553-Prorocentrum_lima.AAC.1